MDSSIISRTTMELIETLDRDFNEDEHKIIECGIVVIIEKEEDVTIRTRSSNGSFHIKLGMWEWAVEVVKSRGSAD